MRDRRARVLEHARAGCRRVPRKAPARSAQVAGRSRNRTASSGLACGRSRHVEGIYRWPEEDVVFKSNRMINNNKIELAWNLRQSAAVRQRGTMVGVPVPI